MARGQLRIYLGAAPGVGKTFAMLDEGWRRRERGTDVVVGYVETHGRAEHRGAARRPRGRARADRSSTAARRSRRWTSTPSSPASPTVALVDELAHTNVPGLPPREALAGRRGAARRRHRRHLDRQHPAPRVAERRRRADHRRQASARRCPTTSCARADQIELVDMTPEALRRRMAHGNIYPPEKVDAALGQLLPRRQPGGAARAGAAVARRPGRRGARRTTARRHGIAEPWETRERVRRRDHRRARRRAPDPPGGAHGARGRTASSSASTCVPHDGLAAADRASCSTRTAQLLEELGGELPRGRRRATSADALARRFAHAENATQIVLGAQPALALARADRAAR